MGKQGSVQLFKNGHSERIADTIWGCSSVTLLGNATADSQRFITPFIKVRMYIDGSKR